MLDNPSDAVQDRITHATVKVKLEKETESVEVTNIEYQLRNGVETIVPPFVVSQDYVWGQLARTVDEDAK